MASKLSKRQFRIEVFKGVFLMEFYEDAELIEQLDIRYDEEGNTSDTELSDELSEEINDKCKQIIEHVESLDKIISDNLDKWKINRIGKVELTIMRVAVYEYKYDGLEAPIVINEAVDIAKIYSGDKAGAFVNGVLAKIVNND